jgi:hypothetical protein
MIGSIENAVIPIYPNPVRQAQLARIAAQQQAARKAGNNMALGCTNVNVCWDFANAPGNRYNQQGRDVLWQNVGLNGLGDFHPARFSVPQNPIRERGNGMLNGLGKLDTSSSANFLASLQNDSTDVGFGAYPNWYYALGALAVLALVGGGAAKGRRR